MKIEATKPERRRYTQGARAQAAEATARRIVDAFLARLMRQWYDEITLDRIAEDAGVTVQTVVRRFGGKEGLLADAVNILGEQINAARATSPGDVGCLVKHLFNDYEQTGDAVIRLLALESRYPSLEKFLDVGRRWHREWITGLFGRELTRLDPTARKQAIDALVIVTDVYTWKLLRRDLKRSVAAAEATATELITATVREFLSIPRSGDG